MHISLSSLQLIFCIFARCIKLFKPYCSCKSPVCFSRWFQGSIRRTFVVSAVEVSIDFIASIHRGANLQVGDVGEVLSVLKCDLICGSPLSSTLLRSALRIRFHNQMDSSFRAICRHSLAVSFSL